MVCTKKAVPEPLEGWPVSSRRVYGPVVRKGSGIGRRGRPRASPVYEETPHGEWQKYVIIDFRARKFEAQGKKTANARFVRVTLNDQVIHENVEMKGPTPAGVTGKEAPQGGLMFQGDHGPVAYRNIRITPVKE